MNYFAYVKDMSVGRIMDIYQTVRELKGYAGTIYKSLSEDALDKAFFHILDNYDEESGGDLEHYATRVVGTILLNKYGHEIEHETSLNNAMNQKSLDMSESLNPLDMLTQDEVVCEDLNSCVEYLTPMFVQDYKFFKYKKSEYRKLSYSGLFSKYSSKTINAAMDLLVEKYEDEMEDITRLSKVCKIRNFAEDRYKKSMDTTVEYRGIFNNILLYSPVNGKYRKLFYLFNIKETIASIINYFYLPPFGKGYKKIGACDVYCTLSGRIVIDKTELTNSIEKEIIGATLAKMPHLKVVQYEKNVKLILSSPKEVECGLVLNIFGEDFPTELRRVVAKRINKR